MSLVAALVGTAMLSHAAVLLLGLIIKDRREERPKREWRYEPRDFNND